MQGTEDLKIYLRRNAVAFVGALSAKLLSYALDRKLSDKRVFPAIDIQRSGTRKEELIIPKEDLQRIWVLRKVLNPLSPVEAMELLIDKLSKTRSNGEFLSNMSSL